MPFERANLSLVCQGGFSIRKLEAVGPFLNKIIYCMVWDWQYTLLYTFVLLKMSAHTRYYMPTLTCASQKAMTPWSDKRQSLRMIDNVDYSIVRDSWQGFSPGIAPLQVTCTCLSGPKRLN